MENYTKLTKVKKKKCPRCGKKVLEDMPVCPDCGLKYELIQNLSNKQAQIELKAKRPQNVLYVTTRPSDVSKKKFWLLFAFLGIFGAHNIYVGKKGRGYYTLITGLLAILGFLVFEIVFYQGGDAYAVEYYFTGPLMTFYLFGLLIWFNDSISLIFSKYKFPASLTKEDYEKVIANKIRGR